MVYLSAQGKSYRSLKLQDVDGFLSECAMQFARSTVCCIASSVRCFTRFLFLRNYTTADLAAGVVAPIQVRWDRPRRSLPWSDVQRLLRAVDMSTPRGRRDYAILLMMATYGLGAGEVIRILLQDIDWDAGTLRVTRPKTRVTIALPLLPPIAKALSCYLRKGRPPHPPTRHVFLQLRNPFGPLSASGAIRNILIKHAKAAGLNAPFLGSHVLRHANASRQIDLGTNPRVLSDILGHRDPESISAYVRIATESLRDVSLPVPR